MTVKSLKILLSRTKDAFLTKIRSKQLILFARIRFLLWRQLSSIYIYIIRSKLQNYDSINKRKKQDREDTALLYIKKEVNTNGQYSIPLYYEIDWYKWYTITLWRQGISFVKISTVIFVRDPLATTTSKETFLWDLRNVFSVLHA